MIGLSYAGVPLNIATEEAAAWVREHLSLTDLFESGRRGWCQGFNLHPDALGFFAGGPVELNRLVWPSSCSRWAYGFFIASKARAQAVVELALPGGRPEAHPLVMSTRKDDGSPAAHTYSDQGSIVASMYLLPPRPLSGLGDLYLLPLVDARYMLWSEHTGQIEFDDVREAREENGTSYTYQTSDDQHRIIRSNVSAQTDSFPDPSGLDDGWSVLIDNTGGQLTLSLAPYALDGQSSVVVPAGRKVLIFSDGETYYTGWSWVYHLMSVAADVEIAHDAIDRDYLYPSSVVQNDCDPLPPWLDTVAWNVGQRIVVGLDGSITATNPPEPVSPDGIDLGTHKMAGGKVLGLWSPQGKAIARSPESGLSVHPDFEYGYWTGTKTALEGTITPASLAGERGIAVLKSPVKSDQATTALASRWVSDLCKWQAGAYDVKYAGIRPVAPSGLYGNIIWTYHAEEVSTRIQYADYPALEWPLHFFQEEDSWCAEFGLLPQLDACLPSRESPGRWCAEFSIPIALESVSRDVTGGRGESHWCATFAVVPGLDACLHGAVSITGILPVASGGTNSGTALNNDRIMVSEADKIVEADALTNGQLLIGSTGSAPVAANITASGGIFVFNGAGSIFLTSETEGRGDALTDNALFGIQTRGSPVSISTDGFGPDRWYIETQNSGVDYSRGDNPFTGTRYYARFAKTGSTGKFLVAQWLPHFPYIFYRGRFCHWQFGLRASHNCTIRVAFFEWAGTADSIPTTTVSAWGADTVVPTWVGSLAAQSGTLSATTSFQYSGFFNPTDFDDATNNIGCLIWTDSQFTAGQYIDLVQAAVYPGAVFATLHPRNPVLDESICAAYSGGPFN